MISETQHGRVRENKQAGGGTKRMKNGKKKEAIELKRGRIGGRGTEKGEALGEGIGIKRKREVRRRNERSGKER